MPEQHTILGLLPEAEHAALSRRELAAQAVLKHKAAGTLGQGELRADLLEERMAARFRHELIGTDAVICASGELTSANLLMCYFCEAISADLLAGSIKGAMLDPAATRIVIDIDCPGGDVAAVELVARAVAEAKAHKPVVVRTQLLASAGYWAMAGATQIYGSRIGVYGSLGVYQVVRDFSQMAAKDGVQVIVVGSGPLKGLGEHGAAASEPQIDDVRRRVLAMAAVMREDLLAGRGDRLTPALLDQLMDGRTAVGSDALALGLIDGLTSLDDLLAGRPAVTSSSTSAPSTGAQETPMSNATKQPGAKASAGDAAPASPPIDPQAKPGASADPAAKPDGGKAITLEELQGMPGGADLIDQIKQSVAAPASSSGSAEPKATLADLRAAFGSNPQFVMDHGDKGWTMTQAKAAFGEQAIKENQTLRAEITGLQARLDVATKASGGSPAAGGGDPAAPAKGEAEVLKQMDAAYLGQREQGKSMQAALSQIAATSPDLHHRAVIAGWKPPTVPTTKAP